GFAERVNSIPKYVASRTLEEPLEWNASLIKGDLAESVASLKRQHGGNLISFGCGELAYELATQGLADEIHFWVNPAAWGSGDRAFHGGPARSEDLGKAMPPAWIGRAPAEFPLGLGVGGAAALGRHHHRSLSGEDPGQPGWEATGRLRPDNLGQLRQPHPSARFRAQGMAA